jgi:phenylpropionate dioxygenase-like ring-hydroxylating dioxygenase large terminal subunit
MARQASGFRRFFDQLANRPVPQKQTPPEMAGFSASGWITPPSRHRTNLRSSRAGRKPLDPDSETVRVATDLPADLVERLDAYATKHECTRARAIREAVGMLLNAK